MNAIHPHWRFDINNTAGSLVIMPCPGCKDVDLSTSLKQLQQGGVTHVLTLMTNEEMEKFEVTGIPKECEALNINWLHFPIEDDCIPSEDDASAWDTARTAIQRAVQNGGSVAVHCKGGSGRAGLCTAMLLLDFGYDLKNAMKMVKEVRPTAFSNPAQVEYLQAYSEGVAA